VQANQPISTSKFDGLLKRMESSAPRIDVFTQDVFCVPRITVTRLRVRVVTELAWHSLFATTFSSGRNATSLMSFEPDFPRSSRCFSQGRPESGRHSERTSSSSTSPGDRDHRRDRVRGEIKEMIFTALELLCCRPRACFRCTAPPMWQRRFRRRALLRAPVAPQDHTLGRPSRPLIGDTSTAEDNGIFNFEGGCYAKTIHIRKESEPEIYAATESFGTILENVVYGLADANPRLRLRGENREYPAGLPVDRIPNAVLSGTGRHPNNVIFLSADAYGVLPRSRARRRPGPTLLPVRLYGPRWPATGNAV